MQTPKDNTTYLIKIRNTPQSDDIVCRCSKNSFADNSVQGTSENGGRSGDVKMWVEARSTRQIAVLRSTLTGTNSNFEYYSKKLRAPDLISSNVRYSEREIDIHCNHTNDFSNVVMGERQDLRPHRENQPIILVTHQRCHTHWAHKSPHSEPHVGSDDMFPKPLVVANKTILKHIMRTCLDLMADLGYQAADKLEVDEYT